MKPQHIISPLLLAVAITGCTDFFNQVVEIEIPEHEPVLAVSGHFRSQDTVLAVYVSSSAGILDPVTLDSAFIETAEVTLLRDGTPWQTLFSVGQGYYGLDLGGALGDEPHTYTLKVTAPGFEAAETSQVMPQTVPILDAVYKTDGSVSPDGDEVNTIDVQFKDPAGEENYYFLDAQVVTADSFGVYTYKLGLNSEDALVENHSTGLIFKDGPVDGKQYILKVWFPDDVHNTPGTHIVLRLHCITRDRYLFLRTLDLYGNAEDNPFAEPVVVHNNVEGGVGIFTVGSMEEWIIDF